MKFKVQRAAVMSFIVSCLIIAGVSAASAGAKRHRYLSASVLSDGGRIASKGTAEIWRDGHIEEAIVRSGDAGSEKIQNIARRTDAPSDLGVISSFGIPLFEIEGDLAEGISWRRRFKFLYRESIVPVTVSYTVERIDALLGRKVAVVAVLLTGFEAALHGGEASRWAGAGREVWDAASRTPRLRILEMRRVSPPEEAGLKLSYAESLVF